VLRAWREYVGEAPDELSTGCAVLRRHASAEYLAFLRSVSGVETTVGMRRAGMAISYRRN
jgi:hypothetical protein